jgi:3-oxoacyl-[acyl-carrier-protein] synthase III
MIESFRSHKTCIAHAAEGFRSLRPSSQLKLEGRDCGRRVCRQVSLTVDGTVKEAALTNTDIDCLGWE